MSNPDHRSRVAAIRRDRMRARLIESALIVFTMKGVEAAVIDDVIELAEVSRGTYYNYFKTNDELMAAVLQEVSNELLSLVDGAIASRTDPAERVACGIRMVLHAVRKCPLLGRFAARVGIEPTLQNSLALVYLPRDLAAGVELGRFHLSDITYGLDLVAGTARTALHALATREGVPEDYPEEITYHVLLGLGMAKSSARRLVGLPIEPVDLPEDSLLVKTQHKHLDIAT